MPSTEASRSLGVGLSGSPLQLPPSETGSSFLRFRICMTPSSPTPQAAYTRLPITSGDRARPRAAFGCSNAEIAPCNEVDVGPVESGSPPCKPNVRMYCGCAGSPQSAITIDWLWRHRLGAATSLLPGRYAMPVLHSHQSLCVLRRPRIAPTSVGFRTLVTSHASYPEAVLPWTLRNK